MPKIHFFFPFSLALRSAVAGEHYAVSAICALFGTRNPLAIRRFVVAVGVFALNLMALRARPHIFQESHKGVSPTLAHRNSPATIVFPRPAVWVGGSLFGVIPRFILPCLLSFYGMSVNYGLFSGYKATVASTGLSVATCEISTICDDKLAATASAPPFMVVFVSPEIFYDGEPPECAACEVDKARVSRNGHETIIDQ